MVRLIVADDNEMITERISYHIKYPLHVQQHKQLFGHSPHLFSPPQTRTQNAK